jgi:hypothetical protein
MKKSTKNRKTKRRVLLRDLTEPDEGYFVADNPGTLFLFSYGRGKGKTVALYGDPKGLRFLATLLNDVADVDQTQIPNNNCPQGIGTHYHVYEHDGRHVHPKSNDLLVGRLDAKGTGSFEWFTPLMDK